MKTLIARDKTGKIPVEALEAERFELRDSETNKSKFIEVDHPDWGEKAERFIVEMCRMLEVEQFEAAHTSNELAESLCRMNVRIATSKDFIFDPNSIFAPNSLFALSPEDVRYGTPFKRKVNLRCEYGIKGQNTLWETALAPILAKGIDLVVYPMIRAARVQVHWDKEANRFDVFDHDGFSRKAAFSKLNPILSALDCNSCIFDAVVYERDASRAYHPAEGLWLRDGAREAQTVHIFATRLIEQDGKVYVDEPAIDRLTRLSMLIGEGKETKHIELRMMPMRVIYEGASLADVSEAKAALLSAARRHNPCGFWFAPLHRGSTEGEAEQMFACKNPAIFNAVVTGVRQIPAPKHEKEFWSGETAATNLERMLESSRTTEATIAIRAGDKLLPVRTGGKLDKGDFEFFWDVVLQDWNGTFDPRHWKLAKGFEPKEGDATPATAKFDKDYLGRGARIGDVVSIRATEAGFLRKNNGKNIFTIRSVQNASATAARNPSSITSLMSDEGFHRDWWDYEFVDATEAIPPRRRLKEIFR